MRYSIGDIATIMVIAFAGVWLIDRGMAMAGLGRFAVNAPNG